MFGAKFLAYNGDTTPHAAGSETFEAIRDDNKIVADSLQ
jgi:hypothetical protein